MPVKDGRVQEEDDVDHAVDVEAKDEVEVVEEDFQLKQKTGTKTRTVMLVLQEHQNQWTKAGDDVKDDERDAKAGSGIEEEELVWMGSTVTPH